MAKKSRRAPLDPDIVSLVESSGNTVPYSCGHRDKTHFVFNIYGERGAPEKAILDRREKCGECLLSELHEQVIRCAGCKLPILPGSPVLTGIPSTDEDRPWATFVRVPRRREKQALICTRSTCCISGGLISGTWDGETYVPCAGGDSLAAVALTTRQPVVANF